MSLLGGIDSGGTKCAVCVGRLTTDGVEVIGKRRFPTPPAPAAALEAFAEAWTELLTEHPG